MQSWQDKINEQIDAAIDRLKAARTAPPNSIELLKAARRAVRAAIALEEAL